MGRHRVASGRLRLFLKERWLRGNDSTEAEGRKSSAAGGRRYFSETRPKKKARREPSRPGAVRYRVAAAVALLLANSKRARSSG
jgi:hypothetical protein